MRHVGAILLTLGLCGAALAAPEDYRLPDTDAAAWRWEASIISFSASNSGIRTELDSDEAIERRVKELKAKGVQTVQFDGLHFRHDYMDRMPRVIPIARRIVEACHREGIRVIEHHSATLTCYASQSGCGFKFLFEHPDWLQRDFQYGNALSTCCLNNPEWRAFFLKYISDYVRETGVDGLQLDEAVFCGPRACGCAHCRAAFTRDTGIPWPSDDADSFFEFDTRRNTFKNDNDPRTARFIEWRSQAIVDFFVAVRKATQAANPNLSLMIYSTHYGLTSDYAVRIGGGSLFQNARIHDWIGTEIMSRNVYACPRAIFFFRKAMQSLGDYAGTPVFAYVYHVDNPVIAKMGWALNAMNRQTSTMPLIEGADMSYTAWPDRMSNRFARSEADIALVFSEATRNFARLAAYLSDLGGYSQCLSDAHIQHDILVSAALTPERLKKYRLLILPSVCSMSDAEVEAVRAFVRNGGRAIITGHTATYTELGMPRNAFALQDVINVRYGPWAPKNISVKQGDAVIPLKLLAFRVQVEDPSRSRVLAELVGSDGATAGPALVESRFGKGTAWYDAVRLGNYHFESERTPGRGQTYDYERSDALHKLTLDLVRSAYGGPLPFEAQGTIPENVFVTVHRQRTDGADRVIVHLLNATGSVPTLGAPIPSDVPADPWPALKEDLSFSIALPGVREAYIVSPDYPERRPVRLQTQDGRTTVTVSRADVISLSAVHLRLN